MVLAEALRARLLAALQPWLAADPAEMRVEPGLCRSLVVARGLELDASALNAAAGETWPARFDRAAVAEVELAASPWSGPALRAVVRGVDVALTLRDPAPKKQRPDYKKRVTKEKKRVLASLDPQVRFDDVTIQVQYLDDSHAFLLRATDLQFGPELVFGSSLFSVLVGSSMSSRKKNSLFVTCAEFDILLKENDSIDSAASFTGISASVRLDNLQLYAFGIHVPNASWQISPKFTPSLMVILDITRQKEEYEVRNGKELWKIAAEMIDNSAVHRRFSVRRAISYAALWRRYVHGYVLLLTSVGYPSDKNVTRNCSRMSKNRKILDTIKDHWDTVIDLEEKIPVEAIARARCAARSKLTVSQQLSKQDSSKAPLVSYMLKVLFPLLYLWRLLVFIWWSLWACIGRGNKANIGCAYIFPSAIHDVDMEVQLSIHLGELSITLLPIAGNFSGIKRLNKGYTTSHIDLPYAHIVIKSSCLLHSAGCTAQSLFFVIGELKTCLSGVPKLLQNDNSNTPRRNSFEKTEFTEDTDSKIILWSDSASMQPFSKQQASKSSNMAELSTALLKCDMDEIWSNWMIISNLYKESGVIHPEKPSAIIELKSFLIDPQFVHYKQLKELAAEIPDISNSDGAYVAPTSGIDEKLRSFSHRMKVLMVGAVPDNTLQIAALVDGPIIPSRYSPTHLRINSHSKKLHNSFLSAKKLEEPHQLQKESSSRDVYPGYAVLDAHFSFAGLTLSINNPEANQQSHVFGPMSVDFQLSTSRNCGSSFFGTKNVISANLGAGIVGCTVLFYMDELLTVCQEELSDLHVELNVGMQLDLESADVIFSASHYPNPDMLINSALNYISSSPVLEGVVTQELLDVLALGVGFCISSSSVKLLLDGECTDFLVSISGIHCMVFENQAQMDIFNGLKHNGTLLSGSVHSKNQLFTSDCVFHLRGGPAKDNLIHEKLEDESRCCWVSASLGMCTTVLKACLLILLGSDYNTATDKNEEREVTTVSFGAHLQNEESQLNAVSVKCLDVELSELSLTLAVADESEYLPFIEADSMLTYGHDAPSSSTSAPGSSTGNTSMEFSLNQYYILKHFSSHLKIEKKISDEDSNLTHLSGDWFGNGSVSGLEVTMSLSNIEMISSLLAPFNRIIMSSGSTHKGRQTIDTTQQAHLDNADYTIPDGAIVAIRDLNQQMYVSVKKTGSTYRVVGAYHYSLAGEHALFKVKHHKRWRSNTQCISLLSLCAKNDEGKELALSFSKGSDLVEVSFYLGKPCSIWSTLPLRFDNFEDEGDDGKTYNVIPKSSYHLVNKKNSYGIAFVDGLLEFVKKPGNPFKLQVLDEAMFSDASRLIVPHMNLDNNTYLDVDDDVSSVLRDRLASQDPKFKIENSSRLALVCHFKDNGDAIVPGQQSTSVFLRNLTFDDNHPHDHNVVSIRLFKEGVFSTIPISIPLHEPGIFSWRTRVSPVKDSRTFSGPFVVVKVSQNSEEGLSLSVQPLLRIYNKSDFPLELRFQRPSNNDEAAFVMVGSGGMVDESSGVFDAMEFSGASKRALMSLALGK
ncbi:hypothetical protein PR202_ga11997 [Eleusine coracana subsp. coracana]|uniref:Vacuolar protein sorting-associated protein 13 VPS13 adaptor binding domain-containing protein n=1 Tax=Eleusine coracana subsp. coracana TaxID=191504 RepID=A0AAV5CAZ4_ELECO|nr:hypothetical protein PR202_ga11997 [Eleusine coracana subsp. coracana]